MLRDNKALRAHIVDEGHLVPRLDQEVIRQAWM